MKNIAKNFTVLFIIVLVAKIIEITRNILVASFLGANDSADIFMSVVTIPDSLVVLVGLDSIKGVINSEFSSIDRNHNRDGLKSMFSNIFTILSVISLIFAIIIVILRNNIIDFLLPGFSEEKKQIAANIALFIFPVFFFKTIIGLFHSILNAFKKFYSPVILNSLPAIILIASFFFPYYKGLLIYNLSISVILGNIIIFILSYILVQKIIGVVKFRRIIFDDFTKKILRGCTALFILLSSEQLFIFSKNFFASYFGEGAISSLNYSRSVSTAIMGLVFASVFSVLVSNLSTMLRFEMKINSKNLFTKTLMSLFYIIVFCVSNFLLLGKEILSVLYLRGNFSADNLISTLKPYNWEVLSLLGFVLYIIPMSLFLAQKQYSRLNKIGSSVYIFGILINYLLSHIFGYYGISMANFVVTLIYGSLLILYSRKIFGRYYNHFKTGLKILSIGAISFLITYFLKNYLLFPAGAINFMNNLNIVILTSVLNIILYISLSYMIKVNYLKEFLNIIRKR